MKALINSNLLNSLKPKNKPYDVRDTKLIGFLVRVNISGKLLFMCEYARGKRITIGKTTVLTVAQARDKALEILNSAAKGIDPTKTKKNKSITLNDFLETEYQPWLKQHRKAATETLAQIRSCFSELLGNKPLIEITPVIIDQWRTRRLKDGKTTETVNRNVATFKAALSKAVLWGHIETHPLAKLKLLKVDRSGKVRFLSPTEEERLRNSALNRDQEIKTKRDSGNEHRRSRGNELYPDLSHLKFADHLQPMILLSINTGIRQGELFSLKWENIDLEHAMLTIEGAYAKSGKTRHIPLNSEALNTLKEWRKQGTSGNLVFPNDEGKEFNNVKKAWAGILKHAKIENFRWHDLRHHFASKLVMAGVDLNTVRELLGHSDLTMTLRYAHLAPEHKANAVEKLVKIQLQETASA